MLISKPKNNHLASISAILYILLGFTWIFFSDRIMLRHSIQTYHWIQTFKGFIYVLTTGLLLYITLYFYEKYKQRQLRYFEALFYQNPLPMWICTETDGQILNCNQAACQNYGYTRDAFLNLTLSALYANPTDLPSELFLEQDTTEHMTQSGQRFFVSLSSQRVPSGLLITALNIDAERRYQEQLQDIIHSLSQQNERLEEFSRVVAHHLRAPVANLLGLLNLYETETPSPSEASARPDKPQSELTPLLYQKLRENTQRLDLTLKDLQRILSEYAQSDYPLEWVQLDDVLSEVLEEMEPNIPPQIQHNFQALPRLFTHRNYLHSMLKQLLDNACQYRSLERPLKVSLTSSQTHHEAQLEIQDNGQGLNLEQQGHKLFRFHQPLPPEGKGRGLGLYLVKTLIELLGGSVSVESKINQGSTFRLYFPLPKSSEEESPSPSPSL